MEDNKKQCIKCFEYKTFNEFHKCKNGRFGLHNYCKLCNSLYKKKYIQNNKEKIQNYKKEPKNRARANFLAKQRYHSNEEYREKYLEKNRIRRRQPTFKEQEKFKSKTNIHYRVKKTCQNRIRMAIAAVKKQLNIDIQKSAKTIELIGCSISELIKFLELKFLPGMNWQNHGYGDDKWHVDHIIPCAFFDLTKPEEQRKCFHYTNLQPLWQKDNLSKKDNII